MREWVALADLLDGWFPRPVSFRTLAIASLVPATQLAATDGWQPLFDSKSLDGWTTVLEKMEPGQDPDRYVQIRDGVIHMYPDTDPDAKVQFGVIVHEKSFSRFQLTFEYRWGEKKFAPRKEALRDAGLLYHASATGKIWPDSVEYQIQEGDSGDIVFLPKAGLTWMRPDPDYAPEGQGDPGMLPEDGGTLRNFTGTNFAYIGRFPEFDTPKGWNRVEVVVHADESAEHLINGRTIARIARIREKDGSRAVSGKIALQLEGAEILYRDVKIRELDKPLQADHSQLSLSGVTGQPTREALVTVTNPTTRAIPATLEITGRDAANFTATLSDATIPAGGSATATVEFTPPDQPGRASAGLRIGSKEEGTFIVLQGIGLAAFEGKNEPPLQSLVHALGIPLDVGGSKLELDTRMEEIGQSQRISNFRAAADGKIRITPMARFSPVGAVPFGIVAAGESELKEIGQLADVSDQVPDAHQTLFPPLADGGSSLEFAAPATPFALFMKGHKYISFTNPEIPTTAPIPHTARVYPVKFLQGREMENAWLVGFEEASNGDYQDVVFLIENVVPTGSGD